MKTLARKCGVNDKVLLFTIWNGLNDQLRNTALQSTQTLDMDYGELLKYLQEMEKVSLAYDPVVPEMKKKSPADNVINAVSIKKFNIAVATHDKVLEAQSKYIQQLIKAYKEYWKNIETQLKSLIKDNRRLTQPYSKFPGKRIVKRKNYKEKNRNNVTAGNNMSSFNLGGSSTTSSSTTNQ